MDVSSLDLTGALKAHFGFDQFRPGQEAVVRSVLSGRNTVAVMPTGAGKSLCYQLPAVLLPGTALVISPLLALMKDQVDALTARGIPATMINSSVSESERFRRIEAMRRGVWKLVYVAPERFKSPQFLQALEGVAISLYAVDEAHCISQWGHDFRPDYTRLGQVRWMLRPPRTMALTATATPEVRDDIVRVLRLKDPQISVAGFDRPNLFLEVAKVSGDADKIERIAHACSAGGGIVYCATRKDVEKVASQLEDYGIDALAYHAGMSDEQRRRVQDEFMRREDAVVCATNAFGMGVDKPELRFVVHFAMPKTVEAYYQEIGRAGRDGKPARALLLFNHADVYVQERMLQANYPSPQLIRRVWSWLRQQHDLVMEASGGASAAIPVDDRSLARRFDASGMEVGAAVKQLERADHLSRVVGGVLLRDPETEPDALRVDFDALERRRELELRMLKRMTDYAYHRACRRAYLLRYFGDRPVPCSGCDVCNGAYEIPGQRPLPIPVKPKVRRRQAAPKPAYSAADDIDFDEAVFEQLKELRSTLARAEGVPAYVIFHDRTLKAIARELPETEEEFLEIPGIGKRKWEAYGPHVLEIVSRAIGRGRTA